MTPVTDPALLAQLNGSSTLSPVTDPDILSQLDPQPVTAVGSAKAIGTGLGAVGVGGLLGLPGDAAAAGDWALGKAGAGQTTRDVFKQSLPLGLGSMPTSQSIYDLLDRIGLVHKAQNPTEQHLENVASFVPQALGGPESLIKNALVRGVLPGVVSDAAGTAAEGTAAELPMRLIGALAAPSGRKSLLKAAEAATPEGDALLQSGRDGFDTFRQTPFAVTPQSMDSWAQSTLRDFGTRRGFTDRTAPQTTSLLNEYVGRNASAVTSNEMDELRTLLRGVQDTGAGRDKDAAGAAIAALNDRIGSFTQRDTVAGSALHAKQTWADANGDYAAGMRARTIDEAAQKASDAAAAANSGKNAGNKYRSTFASIINSKKGMYGFTDAEENAARAMVRGTFIQNRLRGVGNRLGGGGGISSTMLAGLGGVGGGAAGGYEGAGEGTMGGIALAALGALSRNRYNASVARNVAAVSQMVRQRSPMAATMAQPAAQSIPNWAQRILMMHAASQVK